MNISCLYLSLSLLSSSPIFSYPTSSLYTQKNFNHLQISNLFSTFYYRSTIIQSSPIRKSMQSFLNCNFHHLLNRAIEIDSDNILSYQKPLGRTIFSLDFTHVDNCIFQSIHNPTNFGGALMTFSGLEVNNSNFIRCSASEGGAISCHEDFFMSHVSFNACSATTQSGAIDRRTGNTRYKFNIELCDFNYCQSDYFGCFFNLNQGGHSNLKSSNITQSTAKQCVGCFESSSVSFNFKFMLISSSSAKVHNGCIVIRKTLSIQFDHCLFNKCAHSSFVSDAGAVLLVYDVPSDSYIKDSFFVHNKPSDSFTISVSNGNGKLKVFDSYFTGDKNKEINQNNYIEIDSTTKFNFECEIDAFDRIDVDQKEDERIIKWKNEYKNYINDTIGCLAINFSGRDFNDDENAFDLDKDDIDELINSGEENPQDFYIIHFIAIILAVLGAFFLQYFTSCVLRLYQSHKNSRENE